MADKCENKKISFKTMIATGSLAIAVAVIVAGIMGSIYCSKAELATVKEEVKDDMNKLEMKVAEATWKGEAIAVRVQNMETRQIQMNTNLTKLLDRMRVRPVDPPYLKPMPSPPRVIDGVDASP